MPARTTPLDSLPPGATARLVRIGGDRSFRRRLMELGLLPGTAVRLVRRARIGGVLEIEVRGCRLSVRTGEARELLVETEPRRSAERESALAARKPA